MAVATNPIQFVSQRDENAVPIEGTGPDRDRMEERSRPSLADEMITDSVVAMLERLDANARDVADEEGQPLSQPARAFLVRAAAEVVSKALLNPNYSIENFRLIPFARSDGGAHLLVNFAHTGKQISLKVPADGSEAWLSRTGPTESLPGNSILSPEQVGHYLGWLTKKP